MERKCILSSFLLLLLAAHVWAVLPEKRVTIELKDVPIESFLDEVKKQTGFNMLYNAQMFQSAGSVSVSLRNEKWQIALQQVLQPHGYGYVISNDIVIIRKLSEEQIKAQKIKGKVVDESGVPLAGANVNVQYAFGGHGAYVITDYDGNFSFIPSGKEVALVVSYIGFEKKTVNIKKGKMKYYIIMAASENNIDEVLVTGIFNKPKASFTGAATVISKAEIEAVGNRNLLQSIASIDPSFDIQENNSYGSDPNKQLNIEIRGKSSLATDVQNINNLQDNVRNEYNLPLFILDGFEVTSERVMDMNQSDVESVVILKDASATAIYGSRGANGVVVITSVKPQVGKVRVSYSASLNLEIPDLSSYDLMNSFENLEAEQAAGLYTSSTLSTQLQLDELYNKNLKAAQEGVNTDWLHKPVRVGVGQSHRLNIGGGTDQFRYNLHMAYKQITGAMKGSLRNNMNAGMQVTYLLKKIRFTNDLSLGFNNANEGSYGALSDYAKMKPYWRPYDDNGDPVASFSPFLSTNLVYSPLYDALQTSFSKSEYTNIRNTTNMSVDLLQGLRFNMDLGLTQQRGSVDVFKSPKSSDYLGSSAGAASKGSYTKSITKQKAYQLGATLNWAKVWEDHSIYAGANWQMMQNTTESTQIRVLGFLNDKMNDISNGNSYVGDTPTFDEATTRSMGFTGTLNYNYASRYFLDASYRLDGASSFGSQSRWAPFWSVGLGWEFAKERLIKKALPFISSGKFRYSYGVTSTLNFSPYEAFTTYEYNNSVQYNYLTGATIMAYGNPNLKWQDTKQHNWGIDMGLCKNRFTVSANYYRKTTSNLLSDAYLPISHGYSNYKENIGVVRNTGYDLSLVYNVIRPHRKDGFSWSVRTSIYHNNNVLVKLSDAIKKIMEGLEKTNSSDKMLYMYREGHSMDEVYVLQSAGIDPESGERLYVNDDGTVSSEVTGMTKIAVGNSQPKINGRLGTTFRWKGLMVDMSFGCRWGGKRVNTTLLNKVENADITKYNQDRRVLSLRWRNSGDIAAYKDIASATNSYANTFFVFTEKALTFNSLNITYEFPQSWIKRFKMQRLALTGAMTDIFYWSNIEQERGTTYPYTKKPTFTLSCTF